MSVLNENRIRVLGLSLAATVWAWAPGAPAATADGLDDAPYFNLWDSADDVNGGSLAGDGASVTLCGSVNCAGYDSPNNSGSDSGLGLFRVYTGGEWDASAGSGHLDPFLRFAHTEKADDGTYQVYPDNVATSASAGVEAAYNTNYGSHSDDLEGRVTPQPDDRDFINQAKDHPDTQFNHAVRFSDLFQVDEYGNAVTDGLGYVEFLLDVNEPNATDKPYLRMDELKIFIATTDQLNDYDIDGASDPTLFDSAVDGNMVAPDGEIVAKVWDMDSDKWWGDPTNDPDPDLTENGISQSECFPGENSNGANSQVGCGGVVLNNEVGTGGQGDVDYSLLIRVDAFQDAADAAGLASLDDAWVFLYNYAGAADTKQPAGEETLAQANFEEWAFRSKVPEDTTTGGSSVDAPAPLMLMAVGLLGLVRRRRARP